MKPADNIEKLVKKLRYHSSEDRREKIFDAVAAVLEDKQKTKPAIIRPNRWRMIMHSKMTKFAAAAVIIIGVLTGIYQLTGSIDGASVAWADVVKEMNNVRSVTYKKIFLNTGGDSIFTSEITYMEPGYEKKVPSAKSHPIEYIDHTKQRMVRIMDRSKRATIIQRVNTGSGCSKFSNELEWFERMKENKGECIDQEKINGKMTQKFFVPEQDEFSQKMREITLWIDPETNLPVRVKIWRPIENGGTVIMEDFVWNPDVDESFFVFDPPEGYKVDERQIVDDGRRPGKEDIISSLSLWAETFGNKFPSDITELDELKAKIPQQLDENGNPTGEYKQVMRTIEYALDFAELQKQVTDWGYAGEFVEVGDSQKPLFWYKLISPPNSYKVIFGDYHEEVLSAEKLSELKEKLFE